MKIRTSEENGITVEASENELAFLNISSTEDLRVSLLPTNGEVINIMDYPRRTVPRNYHKDKLTHYSVDWNAIKKVAMERGEIPKLLSVILESAKRKLSIIISYSSQEFQIDLFQNPSNFSIPVINSIFEGVYLFGEEEIYKIKIQKDKKRTSAFQKMKEAVKKDIEEKELIWKQMVSKQQEEFRRRMEIINERFASLVILPKINSEIIFKYKIQFYIDDSRLGIRMPFQYNPKFVLDEEGRKYKLEENLKKDVYIHFLLNSSGTELISASLYDEIGGTFFHYHQTREACWGTIQIPRRITGIEELIILKEKLEEVLETIDKSSLANPHPRGLPLADELKINKEEEVEKIWTI